MTIGSQIKEAREANGLTQEQLAERLQTDRSLISKWERDEISPRNSTRQRIWSVLGDPLFKTDKPSKETPPWGIKGLFWLPPSGQMSTYLAEFEKWFSEVDWQDEKCNDHQVAFFYNIMVLAKSNAWDAIKALYRVQPDRQNLLLLHPSDLAWIIKERTKQLPEMAEFLLPSDISKLSEEGKTVRREFTNRYNAYAMGRAFEAVPESTLPIISKSNYDTTLFLKSCELVNGWARTIGIIINDGEHAKIAIIAASNAIRERHIEPTREDVLNAFGDESVCESWKKP